MITVQRLMLQSEVAQLPLSEMEAMDARQSWIVSTIDRPDQRPPPDDDHSWFFWLMMAGRGAGKTRAGAEDAWWYGFRHPGARIAIVAPTSQDCRKTCFEGESGLIARMPPALMANWNRGELQLLMANGTIFQGYSAEEPDRLRGPQHHRAWCDELAAWRYLDDTLDNLLMGLRLGGFPRIVATTTPRPIKRLREIVKDTTTWVDTVSTHANMKNLPAIFVEKIISRYQGTRLGRQELEAKILDDVAGGLWQRSVLDDQRRSRLDRSEWTVESPEGRHVKLVRIVVAVDPASGGLGEDDPTSEGGDECGIMVTALGDDGRGYVLADHTVSGSPAEWGHAVVMAYDDWNADRVIYEANQGGEMVRHTIVTTAAAMRSRQERSADFVPTEAVWASRGKVTRAEPVSALYEQGRVSHVGMHARLEDQMCEFTSNFDRRRMGYSPDRVDALVWGLTHLMLNDAAGTNVQDFYRQSHGEMVSRSQDAAPGTMVALLPLRGQSTAFGRLGTMYTVGPDGLMMVHEEDAASLLGSGMFSKGDD